MFNLIMKPRCAHNIKLLVGSRGLDRLRTSFLNHFIGFTVDPKMDLYKINYRSMRKVFLILLYRRAKITSNY